MNTFHSHQKKAPWRSTYSASSCAIRALVINTLATGLLLDRVAVVLPQVWINMWLGRVHNLVHGLHLAALAFPLVVVGEGRGHGAQTLEGQSSGRVAVDCCGSGNGSGRVRGGGRRC